MSGECRPPPGTLPGSVFDLIRTRAAIAAPPEQTIAVWCDDARWYLWGGDELTPAQACAEGWRINPSRQPALAETPADA